jgi:hypothetical protein
MEGSMSKVRNSDQDYALAKIKCPSGHVVAKALMQPPVYNIVLYRGGWVHDDPGSKPLAVRCARCEEAGIRLDLRGSWQKLEALLRSIVDDPTRGNVDYLIGK